MLLLVTPIFIDTKIILSFWLGDYPSYVINFIKLALISVLIESLSYSLICAIQASGRIALYQSIVGTLIFLNLPISYWFLSIGMVPEFTIIISIIISLISLIVRLKLLNVYIFFPIQAFIMRVIRPILTVTTSAVVLIYIIEQSFPLGNVRIFYSVFTSVIIFTPLICFLGLDSSERLWINKKIDTLKNSRNSKE